MKAIKDNFQAVNKTGPSKTPKKVEKPTTVPPSNSDSGEVIVDVDPPKEVENVNGTAQETDILVVEDEETEKKSTSVESAKKSDSIIEVEDIVVPEEKCLSNLDEMILWLHDTLPLSDEELKGLCITMEDFKVALKTVQPSAKREGFATVPNVTWDDVGSLKDIREELQMSIVVSMYVSSIFGKENGMGGYLKFG